MCSQQKFDVRSLGKDRYLIDSNSSFHNILNEMNLSQRCFDQINKYTIQKLKNKNRHIINVIR